MLRIATTHHIHHPFLPTQESTKQNENHHSWRCWASELGSPKKSNSQQIFSLITGLWLSFNPFEKLCAVVELDRFSPSRDTTKIFETHHPNKHGWRQQELYIYIYLKPNDRHHFFGGLNFRFMGQVFQHVGHFGFYLGMYWVYWVVPLLGSSYHHDYYMFE